MVPRRGTVPFRIEPPDKSGGELGEPWRRPKNEQLTFGMQKQFRV